MHSAGGGGTLQGRGGCAGASVAGAGLAPYTVAVPPSDDHCPRTGRFAFRGSKLLFHLTSNSFCRGVFLATCASAKCGDNIHAVQDIWRHPKTLAAIWPDMETEGLEGGKAGWSMHAMVADHQSIATTVGINAHSADESQTGTAQAPSKCFDVRASDGAALPH